MNCDYLLLHTHVGKYPVVSPVNHTNTVSDNSHIIIYFKVDADEYLTNNPVVSFNHSTNISRWFVKYYAMTNKGIGGEIENISKVLHFYVGLETKTTFSYDYDNGIYAIQVENKCGTSNSHIDIKGKWCN